LLFAEKKENYEEVDDIDLMSSYSMCMQVLPDSRVVVGGNLAFPIRILRKTVKAEIGKARM